MLHRYDRSGSSHTQTSQSKMTSSSDSISIPVNSATNGHKASLLMTSLVSVESEGNRRRARVLIDPGVALSFISNRLVTTFKAKKIPAVTEITCFQQTTAPCS